MNYIITGKTYNSKYIEHPADGIKVLSGEELATSDIRFDAQDKVYIPSETSLSIVLQRMDDPNQVNAVTRLKDKYLCREALRPMYPDFFFRKCRLEDISELEIAHKKIVIKPMKGFFGTGVRIADSSTDLSRLAEEIRQEVSANSRFFPESVLSKDEYIIEEYIEGEEFAVDMYFNASGMPVIMNIYHHPVPQIPDYAHLLYYSSKELFDKYLDAFLSFFTEFGNTMNLQNFPIHAEFKLVGNKFIPIEFNPMRYGGFGLADLTYLSYSVQSIEAYFTNQVPDWQKIWTGRENYTYAFVLAYNGRNTDLSQKQPQHDMFREYLQEKAEIMDYVMPEYQSNPVFAIAYIRTKDFHAMKSLLKTEFEDFFA